VEGDLLPLGQPGVEKLPTQFPEQSLEEAFERYSEQGPEQVAEQAAEQLPLATPHMNPAKKNAEKAEQPLRMAKHVYDLVEKEIRQQPWAKERTVRVNEETNTISLFLVEDAGIEETSPVKIPLFFHAIPVIPHDYGEFSPDVCPIELDTPDMSPSILGLLKSQLYSLYRFLAGIEHVDFYADREVVVTIADAFYGLAIARLESHAFRALKRNCFVVLGHSTPKNRPESAPEPYNRNSICKVYQLLTIVIVLPNMHLDKTFQQHMRFSVALLFHTTSHVPNSYIINPTATNPPIAGAPNKASIHFLPHSGSPK
jgi:hypothetical protein